MLKDNFRRKGGEVQAITTKKLTRASLGEQNFRRHNIKNDSKQILRRPRKDIKKTQGPRGNKK